jgi:hypothetical protein
MAISWLTALKVIPWGDVIEHAPRVLSAARELLDRQRRDRPTPAPEADASAIEGADAGPPALQEMQPQLVAARDDITRLQQTQDQIAQTLAELAEQGTRLVAAVELLRKRTRLLVGVVAVLAIALAAVCVIAV